MIASALATFYAGFTVAVVWGILRLAPVLDVSWAPIRPSLRGYRAPGILHSDATDWIDDLEGLI